MPGAPTAEGGGDSSALSLSVSNFGPIAEANVELRPLTVFVGPSNTGKSYLAVLIYVLHRFFRDDVSQLSGFRLPGAFSLRRGGRVLTEEARKGVHDFAREVIRQVRDVGGGRVVIPEAVAVWVGSMLAAHQERIGFDIKRCFGRDNLQSLIRKDSRRPASIVLRPMETGATAPLEYVVTVEPDDVSLRVAIPQGASVEIGTGDPDEMETLASLAEAERLSPADEDVHLRIADAIIPRRLVGPLGVPAYYLPADRTGVMHAHSVVVSATIEGASMTGLRPTPQTPVLSGVLADFLRQLMVMGQRPRVRRGHSHELWRRLEEHILRGSVQIDRSAPGNYPQFNYRPEGWKEDLPLMTASSMVSDLAPIVLYLRHVVERNDLLIIEEPESHLHPEAQTALAREIVGLVANGIRVLVTTHSDWMLQQFANHVRLSGLEANRQEGVSGSPALPPDRFGAWLFRRKKRRSGSFVEEIPFDPDSGGLDSGYGDVADALYNTWAEIGNRIAAAKASEQA